MIEKLTKVKVGDGGWEVINFSVEVKSKDEVADGGWEVVD